MHIRTFVYFKDDDGLFECSTVIRISFYYSNLGPVTSKHLRRIFVLKMSWDISRTHFLFHKTLKRWEVPTFCPKLRTKKSASYHGIFVLNVCN